MGCGGNITALLQSGAITEVVNSNGRTPLEDAKTEEVAAILRGDRGVTSMNISVCL